MKRAAEQQLIPGLADEGGTMDEVPRAILALAVMGGWVKLIVSAWSGDTGDGKEGLQSAVVRTVAGMVIIFLGFTIFQIPLE